MRAPLGLTLCLLLPTPAKAVDTWTDPFPGVRHLHRTGPDRLSVHAAVVDLCAAGVSVRHTDFSERRQRTSAFAQSVGAQLAINGDWSCRPIDVGPNSPFPPCVGLPEYMTYGIAAHGGVQWPNPPFRDALLAFALGRVEMSDWREHREFEPWMQEAMSGHWTLVRDGQVSMDGETEDARCPRDPRTGIGLSQDRTRLQMLVVDGRNGRRGMTCRESAALLIELGAYSGFGLDGGGSSTMWMEGRGVLNDPSDGSERVVGPHLAVFASGNGPAPFCDRPWRVDDAAPLPQISLSGAPGGYFALSPRRLYDTRSPAGSAALEGAARDASGRVTGGATFTFTSLDAAGVPADATAIAMQLTVVDPAGDGFITAFAGGQPAPDTSNLNHPEGGARANAAIVSLDASRRLSVSSAATAHHLADLSGYFGPGGDGFVPDGPRRRLDTRGGAPLEPRQPRQIIPPQANATAVSLSVVSLASEADGFVTVYPCDAPVPDTSALNYRGGQVVAAALIAAMGPTGVCAVAETRTHLLVDAFGHFGPGDGLLYQPVRPVRVADSRQSQGVWVGRVPSGTVAPIDLRRAPGWPAGVRAVAVNVTAVQAAEGGFISLAPCGRGAVEASVLNFSAGETVANMAIVPLDDGPLCMSLFGRSHALLDVVGVFVPQSGEPPPPPPTDEDAGVPTPPVGGDEPSARDAASPERDAAALEFDAESPERDALSPELDAVAPAIETGAPAAGTSLEGGCACTASASRGASLLWIGLVLAAARPRRRVSRNPPRN